MESAWPDLSPQARAGSTQIVCAILFSSGDRRAFSSRRKENPLDKLGASEESDQRRLLPSVQVPAILKELMATAPALGWLSAQALYLTEPILQSFFSSQTLARWARALEGDEEVQ
jgi:hypothetical protein